MLGYKDREVKQMISKVYFNLHKEVFSVQQNGLVVLHTPALIMEDVTFKVSEAGRQRVLAERRKNVHAFVIGEFVEEFEGNIPGYFRKAYYNPYKVDSFVDAQTFEPLYEAEEVILIDKEIWYR